MKSEKGNRNMAKQFVGQGNIMMTTTMYIYVLVGYLKPLGIHIWQKGTSSTISKMFQTLNQQFLTFPLASKKIGTTYKENTNLVTKALWGLNPDLQKSMPNYNTMQYLHFKS